MTEQVRPVPGGWRRAAAGSGSTCRRGIWAAAASTVSAAKESTLSASFLSSRASESPAATRLALHRLDAV